MEYMLGFAVVAGLIYAYFRLLRRKDGEGSGKGGSGGKGDGTEHF